MRRRDESVLEHLEKDGQECCKENIEKEGMNGLEKYSAGEKRMFCSIHVLLLIPFFLLVDTFLGLGTDFFSKEASGCLPLFQKSYLYVRKCVDQFKGGNCTHSLQKLFENSKAFSVKQQKLNISIRC